MSQGAMDGGVTIPWKGGMSQGAMDGGATIPWKGGMSQGARGGGVTIPWKGGQIFAPVISAFPPSMVVICHKVPG